MSIDRVQVNEGVGVHDVVCVWLEVFVLERASLMAPAFSTSCNICRICARLVRHVYA
jgi:hypothetical protein